MLSFDIRLPKPKHTALLIFLKIWPKNQSPKQKGFYPSCNTWYDLHAIHQLSNVKVSSKCISCQLLPPGNIVFWRKLRWNRDSARGNPHNYTNNARTPKTSKIGTIYASPSTVINLNWIIRELAFKMVVFFRSPTIPRNLDSHTNITIDGETFHIQADDLESQCVLGRGAYGVVEKVKHKQSGTVLAVKVRLTKTYLN